ncbi:DUF3054 domain-containing protein [Leucobacter ruminantium]|uniref:DUF3054 domain-containing protein n=1 Tax=Leucobacter ruminantium TaxID=1289170 RepID=A0A939LYX4_9MICO|nr:DUF3054 domain-containing protein [Leucobacter ruminantium]MBO1804015.1 DUF3054 domain-containing protein [Leucobacter ruminantium]
MSASSVSVAPRGARVRTAVLALLGDAALVLLFAGLGRSSHARDATVLGLLETAWPFLAGLAITWISARISRRPLAIVKSGIPVWLGSVAIGMILRALAGQGTALAFVIVATVTLGVFLLGWRALVALFGRLRRS